MASEAAGASGGVAPNASRFAVLPPERAQVWEGFPRWEREILPTFLGLELEEVRQDYARMRLPYRPELDQPIGAMHGGAIATLIDTTVHRLRGKLRSAGSAVALEAVRGEGFHLAP